MNGIGLSVTPMEVIRREIEMKEIYSTKIKQFVESYDTNNIIFTFNGKEITEAIEGYFGVHSEYEDINEALKALTPQMGIQIKGLENEHRQYRLGYVYNTMNESVSGECVVVNIKTLQDM